MENPPPAPPVADIDTAPAAFPADSRPDSLLTRVAYIIGGIGLLGATLADSLAVAGRHTGLHLIGSIEIVQSCVVLLASAAMLIATLKRNHASVHMVTDRLSVQRRQMLARLSALAGALLFLLLAAGSAWILADLWSGQEETELLHIPLRWLRLLWVMFALLIMARFLIQAAGHREDVA